MPAHKNSHRPSPPVLLVLLVFLNLAHLTTATVVIETDDFMFDAIGDLPADFGPPIPSNGISATLVISDPEDACGPITVPDYIQREEKEEKWIALIVRSQNRNDDCTFDVKVRNAEKAGAIAAIVYDDVLEGLIIMAKPPSHEDPGIPSVFVTLKSGLLLKNLYEPGLSKVFISPVGDILWMSMVLSAFAGCLSVSVLLGAFYLARRPISGPMNGDVESNTGSAAHNQAPHRRRPQGMTADQLSHIPIIIHRHTSAPPPPLSETTTAAAAAALLAVKDATGRPETTTTTTTTTTITPPALGESSSSSCSTSSPATTTTTTPLIPRKALIIRTAGDTKRVCVICLDQYRDGDSLRVLPCRHLFHKECVDLWFAKRVLCPVCKWDATQAVEEDGRDEEEGVDRNNGDLVESDGNGGGGGGRMQQIESSMRRALLGVLRGPWTMLRRPRMMSTHTPIREEEEEGEERRSSSGGTSTTINTINDNLESGRLQLLQHHGNNSGSSPAQ